MISLLSFDLTIKSDKKFPNCRPIKKSLITSKKWQTKDTFTALTDHETNPKQLVDMFQEVMNIAENKSPKHYWYFQTPRSLCQ